MFQLPQFVWALRSSVWDVFINFLLIDATDRSKLSSDQKRFFYRILLSFFANTPFKETIFCYYFLDVYDPPFRPPPVVHEYFSFN